MSITRKTVWVVASLALLAAAAFVTTRAARPNRAVVANLSGAEICQVTLTLKSVGAQSQRHCTRTFAVIAPGETKTVAHALNDSTAILEFVDADGTPRRHETPYIDLWTGQGWVFGIRTGGRVDEGYDIDGLRPQ